MDVGDHQEIWQYETENDDAENSDNSDASSTDSEFFGYRRMRS